MLKNELEEQINALDEIMSCKELRKKIIKNYGLSYYRMYVLDLDAVFSWQSGQYVVTINLPNGYEPRKDILGCILRKENKKFRIVVRGVNFEARQRSFIWMIFYLFYALSLWNRQNRANKGIC